MENLEHQHADVLAALRDFHQQQLFTDFTVQLKEGPVKTSRNILAAMSPVFNQMLTVDMREKRDSEADLKHITKNTWTCIIQFYLGSEKLVSVENVADVLEASHCYQMERLFQHCADFLSSVCCPKNCLEVKRLATLFGLESLATKATRILAANFSTVVLCLEKTELLQLLEKEELFTNEDNLCEALLRWMKAKNADASTCSELLQFVSWKHLTDDRLSTLVDDNRKLGAIPTAQLQADGKNHEHVHQESPSKVQTVLRRRLPYHCADRLVVVGQNSRKKYCFTLWSPEERRWVSHLTPDAIKRGFSSAIVRSSIFITGGMNSKETHIFDLKTQTWSVARDLLQERRNHGMTVIEDSVYAVGGYQDRGAVLSVEEYRDYRKNDLHWNHVGDLQFPTGHRGGVATLGQKIITAGDVEGSRIFQTFDVKTRTLAAVRSKLPCPMRNIQAVSAGSSVFFLGMEGDLLQIREEDETLVIATNVKLQGLQSRRAFGLQITRNSVTVIGGGGSRSVRCWDLRGESLMGGDVGDLPRDLQTVLGVHVYRVSSV